MSDEILKPFLCLPFKEQVHKITEGWHYSEQEKSIHGLSGHGGIDFAFPRGTKVLAAADGWAIASYFWKPVKNKDGSSRLYEGKEVGMGLGYFVQIYHPEVHLYTSYGHLERVVEKIRFHRPIKVKDVLWPIGNKIDPENFSRYRFAKFVRAGDLIGYVGDSGLTWGYLDYPQRPNTHKYPSWDKTHLHFEVFTRIGSRKKKKYFDPYGIKSDFKDYPGSDRLDNLPNMGSKSTVLWSLNHKGMPQFPK